MMKSNRSNQHKKDESSSEDDSSDSDDSSSDEEKQDQPVIQVGHLKVQYQKKDLIKETLFRLD